MSHQRWLTKEHRVEVRDMLTLVGYMMLLPIYILAWSLKLMGKVLSFMFWGVIIILGLCV